MSLVVYQLPHSPYCLPITRALAALQVGFEVLNLSKADRSEVIQLTNGAHYQVPVLAHGDSPQNCRLVHEGSEGEPDGLDVARYVERLWGAGRLFPQPLEGLQSLLVPHIEGELEGVMFKLTDIHYVPAIADLVERTITIRHKERRYGRGCLDQWRANRGALFAQAGALLVPFERMLFSQPFLLGSQPVYTDFALFGVLANLTFNDWNPFPPDLPRLADWFARMKVFCYS